MEVQYNVTLTYAVKERRVQPMRQDRKTWRCKATGAQWPLLGVGWGWLVLGWVSYRDAQHLPLTRNATKGQKKGGGGGRNYTLCYILTKNRGLNTIFPHFCSKIGIETMIEVDFLQFPFESLHYKIFLRLWCKSNTSSGVNQKRSPGRDGSDGGGFTNWLQNIDVRSCGHSHYSRGLVVVLCAQTNQFPW